MANFGRCVSSYHRVGLLTCYHAYAGLCVFCLCLFCSAVSFWLLSAPCAQKGCLLLLLQPLTFRVLVSVVKVTNQGCTIHLGQACASLQFCALYWT
jgi:hypothetical protein